MARRVYLLTRDVIAQFADAPVNPAKGEREITEALRHAMRRGLALRTFQFSGLYVNINRAADRSRAEEILKSSSRPSAASLASPLDHARRGS